MPFPHACGVIAGLTKQPGNGKTPVFDQCWIIPTGHALFETRAPAITTGKNGVAARRAHRRGRVHVGEAHSCAREPIDIGRSGAGMRVEYRRVSPAHIVRQNEHEIRLLLSSQLRQRGCARGQAAHRSTNEMPTSELHDTLPQIGRDIARCGRHLAGMLASSPANATIGRLPYPVATGRDIWYEFVPITKTG